MKLACGLAIATEHGGHWHGFGVGLGVGFGIGIGGGQETLHGQPPIGCAIFSEIAYSTGTGPMGQTIQPQFIGINGIAKTF